jgi:DNA end-binding protein Ku
VLELIERKAQGEEIAVQPAPEVPTAPAPDLMSALKASLDAVRSQEPAVAGNGGAKPSKPRKPAKKPAAKKPAAKKTGSRAAAKR